MLSNGSLYKPLPSVVDKHYLQLWINLVIPNIAILLSIYYPILWGIIFHKYGASFIVIKSFDDVRFS